MDPHQLLATRSPMQFRQVWQSCMGLSTSQIDTLACIAVRCLHDAHNARPTEDGYHRLLLHVQHHTQQYAPIPTHQAMLLAWAYWLIDAGLGTYASTATTGQVVLGKPLSIDAWRMRLGRWARSTRRPPLDQRGRPSHARPHTEKRNTR